MIRTRRGSAFPFIMAVKGRTKAEIIAGFETRVSMNGAEAEFETALQQLSASPCCSVSCHRRRRLLLPQMVSAPNLDLVSARGEARRLESTRITGAFQ